MLDEFVKLTGYSRCYASCILRTYGKKVAVCRNGARTVFIGDDLYNGKGMKVKKERLISISPATIDRLLKVQDHTGRTIIVP